MQDNPGEFVAGIWEDIKDDTIFPSQAQKLLNKVKNKCLAPLVQGGNTIDPFSIGRIILILGILAAKRKNYTVAVRYLKWSVNLFSHCKNLIEEEWKKDNNLQLVLDETRVKNKLLMAHYCLGEIFEEMGMIRESCYHFSKSFKLFKDIPNPTFSSVQGFSYFNLSILAFKCLEFRKAIDFGNRSLELLKQLSSDRNDNRIQLGKTQKLLSLIYSTMGNDDQSEEFLEELEETLQPIPHTARVWLDILYMEIEIFLWKGGGAQGGGGDKFKLDWILSLDDWDVSERLEILVWKLILHHHQKDVDKMNQCIHDLKVMIRENVLTEDLAKAIYGLSRILYLNKDYKGALALVRDLLTELDNIFALDLEFDLKGRLNLFRAEILMSLNADELTIMNCFNSAGKFLKECFSEKHYAFAHFHQCMAQAHLRFKRPLMADKSLKEARDIIVTSFSRQSLTSIKLDFVFVEFYTHKKKLRSAAKLLKEMVEIMETSKILAHEPFCHDSKWQCAELVIDPQAALLHDAKDWLERCEGRQPK